MTIRYPYEYLIHLLDCAIHDRQPQEKPDGIDFNEVFELGRIHEVGNIAFISVDKLENKPEPELYQKWQLFYFHSIQRDARQKNIRNTVLEALHKDGVRTLETQGTITKQYYPETFWRMMSDIDLIVDEENVETIRDVMTGLGYEVKDGDEGEIVATGPNSSYVEFHLDFFTKVVSKRSENYHEMISEPYNHAVLYGDDLTYKTNDTYFYLYMLLHTIKHFLNAGCGIRRVLDLYYTKPLLNEIDMEYVNELIDKFGYRECVDKLYALEEFWFEGKEPKLDIKETISDIILSGNHGVANIRLRNHMRKEKSIDGIRFPKLRRIILFLFPTKEDIYDSYPVAKRKQYSLFMCWIHRAVHSFGKLDNLKDFLKRITNSKV